MGRIRGKGILPVFVVAISILRFCFFGGAVDKAFAEEVQRARVWCERVEAWEVAGEQVLVLLGNVSIWFDVYMLTCDSAVVWLSGGSDEKCRGMRGGMATQGESEVKESGDDGTSSNGESRLSIRAIYAEGNVRLWRIKRLPEIGGELEEGKYPIPPSPASPEHDTVVSAQQMILDLVTGRGLMFEAELRAVQEDGIPIVVRAQVMRQVDRDRYEAEEGFVTTCPFAEPHYRIRAQEIILSDVGETNRIEVRHVLLYVGDVPILYWPYLVWWYGLEVPLKELRVEFSSRLGFCVFSEWGFDINRTEKVIDEGTGVEVERVRKWGEVIIEVDRMRKRGWGLGLDVEYEWEGYEGLLDTYFLNDMGPDAGEEYDRRFLPMETDNRYRVKWRHRDEISQVLRFDAEYSLLSDRNFLEEFFEEEFKKDKPPETYFYLRCLEGNEAATFLYKWRVNDFYTRVEYMPQVSYGIFGEPILGGRAYLFSYWQLDNVRLRYDDARNLPSYRTWRFDSYNEVAVPVPLGPVRLTPLTSGRYTVYEETLVGEGSKGRFAGAVGATLTTDIWRVFDVEWPALGVKGLRHVVTPEVSYWNVVDVNLDTGELVQYDEIDMVKEYEKVTFDIRNTLETKQDGGGVVEIFEFDMKISHFPNARRDNEGELYSDLLAKLRTRLIPGATLSGEGRQGVDGEGFKSGSMSVGVETGPVWAFTLGYNYVRDCIRSVTIGGRVKLSERWSLEMKEEYDFEIREWLRHEVMLFRDMHDWVFEMGFEWDERKEDWSVTVGLVLKGLGRMIGREGL